MTIQLTIDGALSFATGEPFLLNNTALCASVSSFCGCVPGVWGDWGGWMPSGGNTSVSSERRRACYKSTEYSPNETISQVYCIGTSIEEDVCKQEADYKWNSSVMTNWSQCIPFDSNAGCGYGYMIQRSLECVCDPFGDQEVYLNSSMCGDSLTRFLDCYIGCDDSCNIAVSNFILNGSIDLGNPNSSSEFVQIIDLDKMNYSTGFTNIACYSMRVSSMQAVNGTIRITAFSGENPSLMENVAFPSNGTNMTVSMMVENKSDAFFCFHSKLSDMRMRTGVYVSFALFSTGVRWKLGRSPSRACFEWLCVDMNERLIPSRYCVGFKSWNSGGTCYNYNQWSDWSNCEEVGGEYISLSERTCLVNGSPTEESNCINMGLGLASKNDTCKERDCIEWTNWGLWGACNSSCVQLSNRTCILWSWAPSSHLPNPFSKQVEEVQSQTCDEDSCISWSVWNEWGMCNSSCIQERSRSCTRNTRTQTTVSPDFCMAMFSENYREYQPCYQDSCSSRLGWGMWSHWSACPQSCGHSSRYRNCQIVPKSEPYMPCFGEGHETKTCAGCFGPEISMENESCSNFCQRYGYSCQEAIAESIPAASFGQLGFECSQTDTNESNAIYPAVDMQTKICFMRIDGFTCNSSAPGFSRLCICKTAASSIWTEWSNYSLCTETCGHSSRYRSRSCVDEDSGEINIGACDGPDMERLECQYVACPGLKISDANESCTTYCQRNGFQCSDLASDYDSTSLDIFDQLGINCNAKIITTSSPLYPAIQVAEKNCYTSVERVSCNSSDPEYQRLCACKTASEILYGAWSSWSECSVTCGLAVLTRYRACATAIDGCDGESQQKLCDLVPCPIDGNWNEWSDWTPCNATCAHWGQITRWRECDNPAPINDGRPCHGISVEEQDCSLGFLCPVHGGWSLWGSWGLCDKPCGQSTRRRVRYCNNPYPAIGGDPCSGSREETAPCQGLPCAKVTVQVSSNFVDETFKKEMLDLSSLETFVFTEKLMKNILDMYKLCSQCIPPSSIVVHGLQNGTRFLKAKINDP